MKYQEHWLIRCGITSTWEDKKSRRHASEIPAMCVFDPYFRMLWMFSFWLYRLFHMNIKSEFLVGNVPFHFFQESYFAPEFLEIVEFSKTREASMEGLGAKLTKEKGKISSWLDNPTISKPQDIFCKFQKWNKIKEVANV